MAHLSLRPPVRGKERGDFASEDVTVLRGDWRNRELNAPGAEREGRPPH